MATKEVVLSGKAMWANRLFKPESYKEGPPKYSMGLALDKPSLEVFKGLKLKNGIKSSDQGEVITLRRDHNPKVFNGQIIAAGGPPEIKDNAGHAWDPDVAIGNGSAVTVLLSVYDTKMGPGSRLEKVRVEELVEYKPDTTGAVPF